MQTPRQEPESGTRRGPRGAGLVRETKRLQSCAGLNLWGAHAEASPRRIAAPDNDLDRQGEK
jgi:hypothetical protein